MKNAFCERNLKPIFALLAVLIAGTVVWAIVFENKKEPGRTGQRAEAVSPKRTAKGTPGAGQGSPPLPGAVDAVSMATPGGGINLITQPGTRSPSVGFVSPPGPARMQLVAAGPRSAPRGRHAFNTVASLILPSVVGIHATRNQLAGEWGARKGPLRVPAQRGDGVRFADPFDGAPKKFLRNWAYENVGSGFIIDSRGHALTNRHVISETADLLVSVFGRIERDFPATIIAVDPAADLALIRISGAPALPEARLGDSHSAQTGDWVLAFGSPFGLEQTVTQGIISNMRKSLLVEGVSYGDMLQTDAPINRGSSGGPLVNLKAEVVGINTAIYGPSAVFSGTGFAIPVDRAKAFLARCSRFFKRGQEWRN